MQILISLAIPFRQKRETQVVYHLLGKTGWSTVVVMERVKSRMENFHGDALVSFGLFPEDSSAVSRSKAIQAKRSGTSKHKQMERTFPFGISVYLSRNPVFPRKFSFGKTKLSFPFTFHPKFPEFLGK